MHRLLLWTLLLASEHTIAQKQPMNAGDHFPYQNAINFIYPGNDSKGIKSFKGKPLLLVLFGSECVVGFKYLPFLDSLQKKHVDKMSVVLVGKKDKKIADLYAKYQAHYKLSLEIAIDSIIFQRVKVNFLPTFVWINKEGIIQGVSSHEKLSMSIISRFIEGNPLPFGSLPTLNYFDPTRPYIFGGNGGSDSNYLVRTVFGKWDPTLPFYSSEYESVLSNNVFNALGFSLEDLYRYAYFGRHYWGYGDSLNGKVWVNPVFLEPDSTSTIQRYSFSVSYQGNTRPDIQAILRNLLFQQFKYNFSIETKTMPYYAVTIQPEKLESLMTKGGKTSRKSSHGFLNYKNVSINEIIRRIANYSDFDIPFINETNLAGNVDVDVQAIFTDSEHFYAALREIGIIIERKYKTMKVITLSRKNSIAIR